MTMRWIGLLTLAVLALILAACGDDEPRPFAGFERTPTPIVAELSLPAVDTDGAETPFEFVADEGHILVVYFGYTSCPDVCPTTLADIRRATDRDSVDGERVDLAMVTIDPMVDTPEVLTNYVRSFMPDATVIRTLDDDRLRAAADGFGADYGVLEGDDGESQVYHTGSLYAVDSAGGLLLTWPFGTTIDDLENDLSRLLNEAV